MSRLESQPNPARALAISYAPPRARAGLTALLGLDDLLAQTLSTTREPLVGQMRLTWWFEALEALDHAPPPAHPVLQALALDVLPHRVTGAQMAGIIDGWEVLLDAEPLDRARLEDYAAQRGARLFALAGRVLGVSDRDRVAAAGAGWALADLAGHARDADESALARSMAAGALDDAMTQTWSRAGRPLGALALMARMDLTTAPLVDGPRRVARLAWHRLSGR